METAITLQLKDISRECQRKRKYLLIVGLSLSEAQGGKVSAPAAVDSAAAGGGPVEHTHSRDVCSSLFIQGTLRLCLKYCLFIFHNHT